MKAHTPGPWKRRSPRSSLIIGHGSAAIAQCFDVGDWTIANVALIAAAPDLLAALRAVVAAHCDPGNNFRNRDDAMRLARAAIAKAEGR